MVSEVSRNVGGVFLWRMYLVGYLSSPCIMCVQYRGGYHEYRGRYLEYRGGILGTVGDIIMHVCVWGGGGGTS